MHVFSELKTGVVPILTYKYFGNDIIVIIIYEYIVGTENFGNFLNEFFLKNFQNI